MIPLPASSRTRRRALRPAAVLALAVASVLGAALTTSPAGAAGAEWNIARVKGPMSAKGSVIAVVDTGVDATHPAFGGRALAQLDFVGDGKKGDPEGHGTHVAGSAAGGQLDCGNGPKSIGVAPDATILPVRVLDDEGEGTIGDVAAGIRAAADRGATVINLSLGSDIVVRSVNGGGSTLRDAIAYAWGKGSIPVLAAGNDEIAGALLGSGYGGIKAVVVTATDNQDRVAGYATSIGSADWGIAAPGGDASGKDGRDILSSFPGSRCALAAGTSMATPHVAGALAVLRTKGLSPQQAVDRILATARDLGASGYDGTYGAGLLDLGAAVQGLGGSSPQPTSGPPATPAPTATSTAPAATPPVNSGGVPATRPNPSTASGAAGTDTGSTDDGSAVASDTGDSAELELPAATTDDSGDAGRTVEQAAGAGNAPADGGGADAAGGPLVAAAVIACAGAWLVTGRAALARRR